MKFTYFWSRSRKKIWLKGEDSKNFQLIKKIFIDCDSDTFLITVKQINNCCCHLQTRSCFMNEIFKTST
ncbi:phosphoribosyl-AMP cyclohydrolase [Candidatus Vidania fulgoroideorum]